MWKAVILVFQISTNQVTFYTVMDFKTEQACRDFVADSEKDPDPDFVIGGACHKQTDDDPVGGSPLAARQWFADQ